MSFKRHLMCGCMCVYMYVWEQMKDVLGLTSFAEDEPVIECSVYNITSSGDDTLKETSGMSMRRVKE